MNQEAQNTVRVSQQGIGKEDIIYAQRFSAEVEKSRAVTWKHLVEGFLQRFIDESDTVVDIGAGDGHFIKRIKAARRIAVDLSPHVKELEQFGVEVLQVPATELAAYLKLPADVVFMSNFLEHLPDKRILLEVLEACHKALKTGGKLIILQPNIRYVGPAYWDYIDHHIALTEHSLREALEICGYEVELLIPRFLPYTANSGLSKFANLTALYLKLPFLWRIFGKQTFIVARAK